nr:hypothetical protein [Tanacetum cinerariifolium]
PPPYPYSAATQHTPTIIQPSTFQPLRKQKPRKTKTKDTQVPRLSVPIEFVTDEAVNEEMDDRLVRAATTSSSLEVEQDSGVNTPRSGEDILKLNESMDLCTSLQNRVLALEATKTSQAQEINSLKRRVKKLEKKQRSRTYKLKRLYKGRIIDDLDADKDITLVNDQEMFNADKDLQGEEVVVEEEVVADKELIVDAAQVSVAATTVTIDDITLAKALKALKTSNLKIRGIVIKDHEEPSESRITTTISSKKSQDMEEQELLTDAEKVKLFMEFLEKRRKFFAAKRAEEKRNKPPTKAQQRSLITELVEERTKKAQAEIPQEESSKRAGDELKQASSKKQKIDDDTNTTKLK